jgi:repressor LexA
MCEQRKAKQQFTEKQGQYLSYIYYYSKILGYPPAEADIQRYFKVTPPAVHQMIRTLEKRGLIQKVPCEPRTIRVLVSPKELPELE